LLSKERRSWRGLDEQTISFWDFSTSIIFFTIRLELEVCVSKLRKIEGRIPRERIFQEICKILLIASRGVFK